MAAHLHERRMTSERLLVGLAWALLAATIIAKLVGYGLYWRFWAHRVPIGYGADLPVILASNLFAVSAVSVGLFIVMRRPRNLVGWILAVLGLGTSLSVAGLIGGAVGIPRAIEPISSLAGWLSGAAIQPLGGGMLALLTLVFPSGRLISSRWRLAVVLVVVGSLVRFAEVGFARWSLFYYPTYRNPYVLHGPAGDLVHLSRDFNVGLLILFAGFLAATASVAVRYRAAGAEERRQLRFFAVSSAALALAGGLIVHVFLTVPPYMPHGHLEWMLFFLVAALLPVAVGLAITRYRLYEIDRIISRAFVLGALTAVLAGLFSASVVLSQKLFVALTGESSDIAIVLTTLVAAASYTPLRKRLEALAEHSFKYEAAHFGAYRAQLETMLDLIHPDDVADRLLEEVVDEVHAVAGCVTLGVGADRQTATFGIMPDGEPALTIDINGRHGRIGRLVLGPRENGSPYRSVEIAAVTEIADLAGRAVEMPTAHRTRGPGGGMARRGRQAEHVAWAIGTGSGGGTGARARRSQSRRSDRFARWARPGAGLSHHAD